MRDSQRRLYGKPKLRAIHGCLSIEDIKLHPIGRVALEDFKIITPTKREVALRRLRHHKPTRSCSPTGSGSRNPDNCWYKMVGDFDSCLYYNTELSVIQTSIPSNVITIADGLTVADLKGHPIST